MLAPVGVSTSEENLLALVAELRGRLASKLQPGSTKIWGADLLDADDPRSTHILAKCAPAAPPATLAAHAPCHASGCQGNA